MVRVALYFGEPGGRVKIQETLRYPEILQTEPSIRVIYYPTCFLLKIINLLVTRARRTKMSTNIVEYLHSFKDSEPVKPAFLYLFEQPKYICVAGKLKIMAQFY